MLATTIHKSNTTPHHQAGQQHHPWPSARTTTGVVSGPNSVFDDPPSPNRETFTRRLCCCAPNPAPLQRTDPSRPETSPLPALYFVVLLRKEVIQPHLPVRLPCYDFVPIADPTFDSSPHKG